ncbi:phosphoribosylglycinamide formyltransferase-1 [Alkalithermobacter thermoalcaliphilus JW-YL-7 = DSM 7308]|uniref:Phosphoribosylglycinamide formyltransferase n=1 Tax=Alkalithermobacter thermoalcaliphilus JW-YL-7 = DSM 7308 TaxID=1121328 RepID=A0A150FNC8_CLOPD|nr:phosphoribosylglycinamide formyltransferase [[Clostridium] paradoxum JW-YL-7 = DSM 7308]SHK90908.1 phosphoribosylglycinamide formyltransferase-1 [[Clostridium] paradoxum JW-YL-7 = DSM 7308]
MLNIAVLISGNGTNLQSLIDAVNLGQINGQINIVISNKENAYGLDRAKKNNIKALYEENEEIILDILKKENIDLVVLAGYLKKVGEKFVREFENKIINVHPSLIPAFCGKGYYSDNVHKAVIDYGVKITGATVHFVDEKLDNGPIIMQRCVNVCQNDTVETLKNKVLQVEHEILVESVRLYCLGKIKIQGRKVIIDE